MKTKVHDAILNLNKYYNSKNKLYIIQTYYNNLTSTMNLNYIL